VVSSSSHMVFGFCKDRATMEVKGCPEEGGEAPLASPRSSGGEGGDLGFPPAEPLAY
jgi:hypothetical protein